MRAVRSSSFLVVLCVLIIVIARDSAMVASVNLDSPAAILARYSRRQDNVWCWRDICPEHILLRDAANQIGDINYVDAQLNVFSLRWLEPIVLWKVSAEAVNIQSQVIDRILLALPESHRFTLGEAMVVFGTPQRIFYSRNRVARLFWMSICFDGGVCAEISSAERQLTPQSEVYAIYFRSPWVMADRLSGDRDELVQIWRGFRTRLI